MNSIAISVLKSIDHISRTEGNVYNITFEQGKFISAIINAINAKKVLELGVSHGFSTIFLADAVSTSGGKVISIEQNPEKVAIAANNLKKAGLMDYVEIRQGSAQKILPKLQQEFDLVFLDINKDQYIPALELFLPKLRKRGIIIADNISTHPVETKAYIERVRNDKNLQSVMVPIGHGMEMTLIL